MGTKLARSLIEVNREIFVVCDRKTFGCNWVGKYSHSFSLTSLASRIVSSQARLSVKSTEPGSVVSVSEAR